MPLHNCRGEVVGRTTLGEYVTTTKQCSTCKSVWTSSIAISRPFLEEVWKAAIDKENMSKSASSIVTREFLKAVSEENARAVKATRDFLIGNLLDLRRRDVRLTHCSIDKVADKITLSFTIATSQDSCDYACHWYQDVLENLGEPITSLIERELENALLKLPEVEEAIVPNEPRKLAPIHPSAAALLKYFTHEHLPPHLKEVSAPICAIARVMAETLEGPELTAGLRKLLEAKDCFVRAAVK